MRILALDTATEACSVAFGDGTRVITRAEVAPRAHASLLLAMVESVLAEAGCALADLDRLAFGRGPGSFTGLRIAASVVQGLAWGAGKPVVPVSDLAALARGAWRQHGATRIWAVMDARMGEVYAARFVLEGHGSPALQGVEEVGAPARVCGPDGPGWFLAGSGAAAHAHALQARLDAPLGVDARALPWAEDVLALAREAPAVAADAAQPVYLRDRVAEPPRS